MSDQPENQGPEPGSKEYNEQMAGKFRNPETDDPRADQPEVPAMPENGAEKFYNSETGEYDWQSHAKEAEYRLQQLKSGDEKDGETASNANADPNSQADDNPADNAEVADVIQKAGLSVEDLEAEIANSGEITAESRAALVKSGIPESLIDSYTTLATNYAQQSAKEALDYVGGDEGWQKVQTWAEANLSEADKQRYNEQLGSKHWREAVDAIRYRMGQNKHTGREGSLITDGSHSSGASGYRSRAEMRQDMADDRYQRDPAFRKAVYEKMKAATWDLDRSGV